jgi:hypothetical protein
MEKFKRYLGIAFSLLFLVLFIKVPDSFRPNPAMLTPVDNTAIMNITAGRSDKFQLWRQATNFMNKCDTRGESKCSELSENIQFEVFLNNLAAMDTLTPGLWAAWDKTRELDWKNPPKEKREFYAMANVAIAKYLETIQSQLRVTAYLVNIGLLLAILTGIWLRQGIGDILWSPVALAGRILSGGAKTAKKLHDKV